MLFEHVPGDFSDLINYNYWDLETCRKLKVRKVLFLTYRRCHLQPQNWRFSTIPGLLRGEIHNGKGWPGPGHKGSHRSDHFLAGQLKGVGRKDGKENRSSIYL